MPLFGFDLFIQLFFFPRDLRWNLYGNFNILITGRTRAFYTFSLQAELLTLLRTGRDRQFHIAVDSRYIDLCS